MKKIDNKLFYQVAAWMINDLNLKGQELICYAIIYSLSQLGQGRYFAGLDYLASFMQCSQPTASKALKGLQDRGLIDKEEVTTDTGRRVLYYCTNPDEDEKESYRGVNKKFMDGVNKKFMDNNIKDIENKKRLSNDNPKDDYPDDFLEFYNAYGYAKSKSKAYQSWKKLSKKDKKAAIDAIPAYKEDCKANDREMKYPSTYLNQRTWEDDFNISKKSVLCYDPLPDDEDKVLRFKRWMRENHAEIEYTEKPLTFDGYMRLQNEYGMDEVCNQLDYIDANIGRFRKSDIEASIKYYFEHQQYD